MGKREATNGEIPTSKKIMNQMRMTWSKGAVPPRFGYFVEGQSNSHGRRRRRPLGEMLFFVCYRFRSKPITYKKERDPMFGSRSHAE